MSYKIAAFDLDGTLLDSKKELSKENREALYRIAEKGIKVVPCTGRLFKGLPEVIRNMPFIEYAITVNGARVISVDRHSDGSSGVGEAVYQAEIDLQTALSVMEFLENYPVIYDCYAMDKAFISASMYEAVEDFVWDPIYIDMVRKLRTKVPDLRQYIEKQGSGVQKIQLYTKDDGLRRELFHEIRSRFPGISPTSSTESNIELNDMKANKGDALKALADHLGVPVCETIGFGDGLNDVPLVREAGFGVAMRNACPEVIREADFVTLGNNENGVAYALKKYVLLD